MGDPLRKKWIRTKPTAAAPNGGPLFRKVVYEVVRSIPRGRVATYGQVAILAGHPRRARHVGQALARMPPGIDLPWHRVINAQGRISARTLQPRRHRTPREAERRQQRLLEREGIRFRNGRVEFAHYLWRPAPGDD